MFEYSITETIGLGKTYTFDDINGGVYHLAIWGEHYSLHTSALRIEGAEKDLLLSFESDPDLDNPCTLEAWRGDFQLIIPPNAYDFLVKHTNISGGEK